MRPFQAVDLLISATIGGIAAAQRNIDVEFRSFGKSSSDALDPVVTDAYYAALEGDCTKLGLAASLATVKKMREVIKISLA